MIKTLNVYRETHIPQTHKSLQEYQKVIMVKS